MRNCFPGEAKNHTCAMHVFQYLLCLIYLISFASASDRSASDNSSDGSSGEEYMLTAEESTRLGQLILLGDDKQAIIDLLGDGPYAYGPEFRGHLQSMAELDRVDSFEYLLSNLVDKGYEDMIGLLDFALKEHKVEICQRILENGDDDDYGALVTMDNNDELLGFWTKHPFLWTWNELDDLLETDRFLLHYICPRPAFFGLGLDAPTTMLGVRLLCVFGREDDYFWDDLAEVLEDVLDANLDDDGMAGIIRYLIEEEADVSQEMCDEIAESHPNHINSATALRDGLADYNHAQQLKELMIDGDLIPNSPPAFLAGRPFRYSRYAVYVLEKAIKYDRIGFLEALLPTLQSLPAANYNESMTTLSLASIHKHRPEMCRLLLHHRFDYEHSECRYSFSYFWSYRASAWEPQELLDILASAPHLGRHFCFPQNRWRDCANPRAISLLISINHRYGAEIRKEYVDPTAMLKTVLGLGLSDKDCSAIVQQLSELGAEVTEEMRAQFLQRHPWHMEVLQALDDILSIPDVKEVEA
jgi:hypothetical protein